MFKTLIVQNFYQDSIKLMLLSRKLAKMQHVNEVSAIMATANNISILKMAQMYTAEAQTARPDDIVVVVDGQDEQVCNFVLEAAKNEIEGRGSREMDVSSDAEEMPKSLESASKCMESANLTLISVPGKYAFDLANKSLDLGISPMIFSDNVSLDEEVRLKKRAKALGLIVMGPDCGTSILGGACIGFGNKVRKGTIGIVGASGTGIQEVLCLLHNNGGGISHAIGTGGRDLHKEVGGISMLTGIDLLDEDEGTQIIVLISKPADPEVEEKVIKRVQKGHKPTVVCFLGGKPTRDTYGHIYFENTLEGASQKALELVGIREKEEKKECLCESCQIGTYIRGLYTGGTLAYEALCLIKQQLQDIYSNIQMDGIREMENSMVGELNSIVDLGDDEFTKGRAHPMIDPSIRNNLIVQEAVANQVEVLMMDFVLGYGCNADPVGEAVKSLKQAQEKVQNMGKSMHFLGHVCGTNIDPQCLEKQESQLKNLGIEVYGTNAAMTRAAIKYVKKEV